MLNITAKITGLKYSPLLCRSLKTYKFEDLESAFEKDASFKLVKDLNLFALSWWVSAKRTRSYPYARVYDTLGFSGKKVTIIPIFKDEGKRGDRDFLQWDTVSLMSILGIYVIIAYYVAAVKNPRYENKITNQRFDVNYIQTKIQEIVSYQSDALHWNVKQIDEIDVIGKKAIESYGRIAKRLGVEFHSNIGALKRIETISKDRESFMKLSRDLAKKAQFREGITDQPSEKVDGSKSTITITNWLGGKYYFTSDEVWIENDQIFLVEAKHTRTSTLPSIGDIKDGLIKMDLFTNLEEVKIGEKEYKPVPVLKLTSNRRSPVNALSRSQSKTMQLLLEEARINGFKILLNDKFIQPYSLANKNR